MNTALKCAQMVGKDLIFRNMMLTTGTGFTYTTMGQGHRI